ncbi:GNAT family N-acetyltransferase [Actinomadura kijaniata]|uniref:GNAT family N-acetyltransferase n=1 Tax=Actinomadura kijaniata TaxID=46161 RepID=UPI0008365CAD|nr:GNAT family N-acetyltransferase [Actinomadura kijaniata]
MEIRSLTFDEMDVTRSIRSQAFGRFSDADWAETMRVARPVVEAGRQYGGFDGDRLVATARLHDMTQWWHGRPVSMGGVGGVAVAPEERGRGLGRRMMTEVLRRCAEYGHPLSMLYPATTPLYRSLGWEHAGALHVAELRTEALRGVGGERVAVRRAGAGDAAEVAAVIARVHGTAGDCGPVGWREEVWRAFLAEDDRFFYLAADGYLAYQWSGPSELEVERVVAASEATLRALWAIVGSTSSTADTVRAHVAPDDPVLWLLGERTAERVERTRWMLRVVDAPAAIGARGFPAAVDASVPLRIDDPHLPANSGDWLLSVKEGRGVLEPSGGVADPVRVGVRGLSALYAGVPVATLRRSGLLEGGGAADLAALGAVFAAVPFSLDHF